MDAHASSATADRLPASSVSSVPSELEESIKALAQRRDAPDVLLGKKLLLLKEKTSHGEWRETVTRLGFSEKLVRGVMSIARRMVNLPHLVAAAKSRGHLLELMTLDDDELQALNAGQTVRGIVKEDLGRLTVKGLREKLQAGKSANVVGIQSGPAPAAAPADTSAPGFGLPPEAAPVLGTFTAEHGALPALHPGDRIESLYARRPGSVVKVYEDGSACVLWDDGTPQEEGLGHERVPRKLLALVPSGAADVAGESGQALPEDAPEALPAVYTLLPGDFEGAAYSILAHLGRTWVIAEELAALLAETNEAAEAAELDEIIGSTFDAGWPLDSYAKVRLASTVLTVRILDQDAVAYVCSNLGTATAQRFAQGFCHRPSLAESPLPTHPLPAAPLPEALDSLLDDLNDRESELWVMVNRVQSQVKAIATLAFNFPEKEGLTCQLGNMAELADLALNPFDDLSDKLEHIRMALRVQMGEALTPPTREGEPAPAGVWLDLVAELATDHSYSGAVGMESLCGIARRLRLHAVATPEAGPALELINIFMRRHGACLYGREEVGIAWDWSAGRAPHQLRARAAPESALAH